MNHRPEIDGLRAVAVLPVILFHAGFTLFGGGFVGVDVFFVISGYLITTILLTEIAENRFSLARFYERRARRILPALFTVMAVCLPFAYLWMTPKELETFSASVVTVVLSLSNLFFLSKLGYFAPQADLQPLLHTWSLAIEEQYYLLFPLLLVATRRRPRLQLGLVAGFVALSFAFSEWGWRENAERSFFFTLSRFWEIGAGSLAAFFALRTTPRGNGALGLAGLAMILAAVFAYDETIPFPSGYALLPVLGTTLVLLFATRGTLAARLLSLRPLVGIGLVSYSAYLWHQPLLAFARLRLNHPGPEVMGLLVAASLLLAWLTWAAVEQPFRAGGKAPLPTRRHVFAASAAAASVFIALGLTGYLGHGLDGRLDPALARFSETAIAHVKDSEPCFLEPKDPIAFPDPVCAHPGRDGRLRVLLAGDSHTHAISRVLGASLTDSGTGWYLASASGCVPLRGLEPYGQIKDRQCPRINEALYDFAHRQGFDTIVLTARFPWYYQGAQFDNGEGGIEDGEVGWVDVAGQTDSHGDSDDRRARVLAAYDRDIRALARDFKVVLVYPIPEAGWNVPTEAFRRARFEGQDVLTTSLAAYKARTAPVTALFDRLGADVPNVFPARVAPRLCDEATGRCLNADATSVYYYDDDHLSDAGAALVLPAIRQAIDTALSSPLRR